MSEVLFFLTFVSVYANSLGMKNIELYAGRNGKCYVSEYFLSLSDKQKKKVRFIFDLIRKQPAISSEYLKKLHGTDDIWEIRVGFGNDTFRFSGFFKSETFIILNHAFTKKTQKTPKKEIRISERRKKEWEKDNGF